jgi:hypothetical protein
LLLGSRVRNGQQSVAAETVLGIAWGLEATSGDEKARVPPGVVAVL